MIHLVVSAVLGRSVALGLSLPQLFCLSFLWNAASVTEKMDIIKQKTIKYCFILENNWAKKCINFCFAMKIYFKLT